LFKQSCRVNLICAALDKGAGGTGKKEAELPTTEYWWCWRVAEE
jgi:hypothetical protein